jgi:ribose transport system substrate-binding protein
MRAKTIHGLVLQDPLRMGQLSIEALAKHLRGEKVEKTIDTGVYLATPENMDEPRSKELLAPPIEVWLAREKELPAGGPGVLPIAVIPKGATHEFWKTIHAGAVKGALAAGNVAIIWKGPLKEDDREEQIKVVDMIRDRAVSGILLAPLDDKALRGPVANAVRAGIPVVAFDSKLDSTDHLSLVETNNYASGRLAGNYMATLLGGKGNVIVLRLHEGSASTTERERGFLDAVRAAPGIAVVSRFSLALNPLSTVAPPYWLELTTVMPGTARIASRKPCSRSVVLADPS